MGSPKANVYPLPGVGLILDNLAHVGCYGAQGRATDTSQERALTDYGA